MYNPQAFELSTVQHDFRQWQQWMVGGGWDRLRRPRTCSAAHVCLMLHQQLGISGGSARASLYVYSTKEDVDAFITSLEATLKMFEGLGE